MSLMGSWYDLVSATDILGMVAGGESVHGVWVSLLVAGAEAGVVHQEVLRQGWIFCSRMEWLWIQ